MEVIMYSKISHYCENEPPIRVTQDLDASAKDVVLSNSLLYRNWPIRCEYSNESFTAVKRFKIFYEITSSVSQVSSCNKTLKLETPSINPVNDAFTLPISSLKNGTLLIPFFLLSMCFKVSAIR